MKKLFALTLFLCLAVTAGASTTVYITYDHGSGVKGTDSGDTNDYVGPYTLTLALSKGGAGTTISATCISYLQSIGTGETWTATETPVVDFSDPAPYLEAAWLDMQFPALTSANATTISSIQEAIWDIFDSAIPFPKTQKVGNTTTLTAVGQLVANAVADYSTQVNANNFSVLVPVSGTQNPSCDGLPQSFLVEVGTPTPEPGAIYMMLGGIGLIGMGRIVRRKRSA